MPVHIPCTVTGARFAVAAAALFTTLILPSAGRAQRDPAAPAPASPSVVPSPIIVTPPAAVTAAPAPPGSPAAPTAAVVTGSGSGLEYTVTTASGNVLRYVVSDDDMRVSPDLRNVSVREAARRLAEQSKREIIVDPDVTESARVSLSAQNVQLTTVLDLISQSAGVRWGREVKPTTALKPGKTNSTIYRIGKINSLIAPALRLTAPGNTYLNRLIVRPNQSRSTTVAPAYEGGAGLLYSLSQRETRSTFTCPHCKRQATVIRKTEAPKCPQCERVFQPTWQFCPQDGTRRPAGESAWKNCPFCGKTVSGVASVLGETTGTGVRLATPVGPVHLDYGFGEDGHGHAHFSIGQAF